ncbi:MAG: hypothetical protein CME62_12540 [Halobacteriovoraceae bacterium]|nr:hypothetical protein [Halobacteriovoraceae bacterium]
MDTYKVEKPVLKNFFALMAFVAAVGFTFFFLPSVYLLLVVPVSLTLSLLYLSKEANPISF